MHPPVVPARQTSAPRAIRLTPREEHTVTLRLKHWRGPTGRAALLVLAATLIPIPAMASDGSPTPAPATHVRTTQATLGQAVAREASRTPLVSARTAHHDDQSTASKESTGFFHSRPGMIAL